MERSRSKNMTLGALFLFGSGLILSTFLMEGVNSAQAQFSRKGDPKPNQSCIVVDAAPSCATCPDELDQCTNVIPDSIVEGFCQATSGSQGITCEEGCFDCGLQINCQTRDITTTPCSDVTGLCQDF